MYSVEATADKASRFGIDSTSSNESASNRIWRANDKHSGI